MESFSYLVTDDGELSYTIRQKDICASVDMASATKVRPPSLFFI